MTISFMHPWAALFALLLPLLWRPLGQRVTTVHKLLRTAIFVCIIAALMQPSFIRPSDQGVRIVLLDQRDHLSPQTRKKARDHFEALRRRLPTEHVRLLQMGGTPIDARVDDHIMIAPAQAASLSHVLETALATVPLGDGATMTIISDGLSSDNHWGAVVRDIRQRGVRIDALPLSPPVRPAFLANMQVAPVRVGEMAQAILSIEGQGRDLGIALFSGPVAIARSQPFDVEGQRTIRLDFPADKAGFQPLRAELTGGARSVIHGVAAVQDPLPLLYIGDRQANAAAPLQRLLGNGFAVRQADAASIRDAERYPVVMLDDMPAARFPAPMQRQLLEQVRQGTGLLYSGGEAAFGTGGYDHSPMADALPVTLRQKARVQKPSVALAIVIDSSGSMEGQPMELAKQIARYAVRALTPIDSVGVVEFYGARQWSVPMQKATDVTQIERMIGRMRAQGGTVLYPAIQEAYYGLRNSDARYRHMLIISDAGVEEARYEPLLRHIAQDRINVSTAQVAGDTQGEAVMADWARWGQGRYYGIDDESNIVQLRLNIPQTKAAPGYQQGQFAPQGATGSYWWGGMSLTDMPSLAGYAMTGARDGAETVLHTATGDPLLASRPYGAGRITALMTEPLGRGTASWRGWPGYGQWLGRVIARTADQQQDGDIVINRNFDRLNLLIRGHGRGAPPQVSLHGFDGQIRQKSVAMEERAPGLFTADVPFDPTWPALVEVRNGARVYRGAERALSDRDATDRMQTARAMPLASLARMTGGTLIGEGADTLPLGMIGPGGRFVSTNLWSQLLLLALFLYLAELAYRRWPTRRLPA